MLNTNTGYSSDKNFRQIRWSNKGNYLKLLRSNDVMSASDSIDFLNDEKGTSIVWNKWIHYLAYLKKIVLNCVFVESSRTKLSIGRFTGNWFLTCYLCLPPTSFSQSTRVLIKLTQAFDTTSFFPIPCILKIYDIPTILDEVRFIYLSYRAPNTFFLFLATRLYEKSI